MCKHSEGEGNNGRGNKGMEKLGNVLISVMQDLSKISTNGSAHVRVNENLCDPVTFRKLFDYFSRGTIIEHVDLSVENFQTRMQCSCGESRTIEGDHPGYMKCPNCGKFAEIRDDSYQLVSPNPEKAGQRQTIRF